MATAVRFTARGTLHYSVTFTYDPTVVAIVKTVPAYARTYEPATKMWMVDADHAQTLADDLRQAGYTVIGMQRSIDWAKNMLVAVGPKRAAQVRRALSSVLHPDLPSGDADLQRELNTAYDEMAARYKDAR
jgi:hypothetical protein